MSDTMERDKSGQLTAREIEEEEMKRELTGIGIYEPGFTYKEMKTILGFLNESKSTSNTLCDNKNKRTQQSVDNERTSEATLEMNASQEVAMQECADLPRSTYSYKTNRSSSTANERKARYSSSPENSSLFDARNSVYRHKSSDSDEVAERQHETMNTHNINRFSLRSGNTLRESQNAAELKTSGQSEHNQKLERWRFNPLDVCINENDVPLRQPSRPSAQERVPFRCCKEVYTSEQRDEVLQALNLHLKEMADLWCSWHCPTNSKFQWGSPIQVGTANGSLDRKPLTDTKIEQQIKAKYICEDSQARGNKRKTAFFIANKESSTEEEDDQYDFICIKKKKTYLNEEMNNIDHSNKYEQANYDRTTTSANEEHSIDDDNSNNSNFDNEDIKSLHLNTKNDKENRSLSPDLITYPRRIVPPNPKARLNLSKQRNNIASQPNKKICIDGDKNIEEMRNEKKANTMMDIDIRRKMEKDSDEEETVITVKKDIEIRPLPIPKEIQSRLQERRLLSRKTRINRERRSKSKKEEDEREQNEEARIKERKEKEKSYRVGNNINWEQLLSDEDESSSEINLECDIQNGNQCNNVCTSINHISCPICNQLFPRDEIEDHAADCEQFETNNEEDNNINQLECNICSNYKTYNGIEYEEHIQQCINNKNDRRHLHGIEDIDIDTIPTSSFHSYKPISEQKDSEIDYMHQFSPYSKSRIFSNKKRKH